MKKSLLISFIAVFAFVSYNANAQTSSATTAVVKNPWSIAGFLRTERTFAEKPATGLSNYMFFQVGHPVLASLADDLSLRLRVQGERTGVDSRDFTILEPAVILNKGKIFEIAGVTASAQLRYYAPVTSDSSATTNPHRGVWRQIVGFARDLTPKLSLSSENFVQYYAYRSDVNSSKPLAPASNHRWRVYNDVYAAYKLNDLVTLKSGLEFENRWGKSVKNPSEMVTTKSLTEWVNVASFAPTKNLSVDTAVYLSAPHQQLANYNDARAKNTTFRLDLSYSFL